MKRTAAVAVGEKHSLAVQRWSAAQLEGMVAVPWLQQPAPAAPPGAAAAATAAAEEEDRWFQRAADGLMEDGRLARLPFSVISDRDRRDLLYQAGVGSSVPDPHQERPSVKKDADPDCS